MTTITATQLRNHLFETLQEVSKGETVTIEWNGKEVGRIIPIQSGNWRKKMRLRPRLRVSPEKAFEPLDDLWAEYT